MLAWKCSPGHQRASIVSAKLRQHIADPNSFKVVTDAPLRPALTRLLLHVEEMIAFDYWLFADAEYDDLWRFVSDT